MRLKSEAFNIFKKFKVLGDKQTDYCIKMLRSNRREYNSKEFY